MDRHELERNAAAERFGDAERLVLYAAATIGDDEGGAFTRGINGGHDALVLRSSAGFKRRRPVSATPP
jgi:hypothetical protein